MTCRRSPAVVAGLLGVVAFGTTMAAFAEEGALPLDASPSLNLAQLGLTGIDLTSINAETAGALGISCACGALVSMGTYALLRAISRKRAVANPHEPESATEKPAESTQAGDAPRAAHAPRHMRPRDWERAGCLSAAEKAEEIADGLAAKDASGMHAAHGYEQIAENYVSKQTFRQRMATRAQGVAATLSARIDANRMEGLPVIERADGSVGDVGTAWWTAAMGPSISGPIDVSDGTADAIPSEFGAEGINDLQFMSVGPRDISRRVSPVEEDAYPEKRSVGDAGDDDWDRALKAMDERLGVSGAFAAQPVAARAGAVAPLEPFSDCVGDEGSIDEPEGIEQDTEFLYFRPPAGHPEVVDTETYVDYLVAEEFSRNPSAAVRKSSRDYLRIIEGGTQTGGLRVQGRHMAPRRGGDSMGKTTGSIGKTGRYKPRHFAGSAPLSHVDALEA